MRNHVRDKRMCGFGMAQAIQQVTNRSWVGNNAVGSGEWLFLPGRKAMSIRESVEEAATVL